MPFAFATPGSGPSAGGIGWFNFGQGFTIAPNQVYNNLTGTLLNGVTVTFDLTLRTLSGTPSSFSSITVPNGASYFGNVTGGYTGLSTSYVGLLSTYLGEAAEMSFEITNIVVRDVQNNILPNYTGVVVDAQTTTGYPAYHETQTYITNGGDWIELAKLGNTGAPILTLNGQTATLVGTTPGINTVYVLTTTSPTSMTINVSWPQVNVGAGSTQAIAFGFAVNQVELYKVINGRRTPADQFALSVAGTPSALATTSGAANGLQTAFASANAIPGNLYTINEAMAPGSVSTITDYAKTVSVVNLAGGGTQPVIGPLPETVTPILGDVLQYTITNTPYPTATKTVTPAFAQPGDTLTYTVSVTNPSTEPATNVLVTDPAPAGTTYAGGLSVSVSYTGTTPDGGITLTSIPAGGTATVSWNVTVDAGLPEANPILNQATISGNGYSFTTEPATTQINLANVTALKSVDKSFAGEGEILTYTVQLSNTGNVNATNVTLTDAVPAGTTFVPGSVTGATGVPPTLTLAAPIAPGGNTTVTYQVQVGSAMPVPNPIPNTAAVNYTYTVNPANPDGAKGTQNSNTVTTQVNMASVTTTKAVDVDYAANGQTITYTLTVRNTGNVDATNVTITDAVPSGTTFVPDSVTGASGTPPTLTLPAALAPNGTAVVTYQVQVGDTLPVPNPILNTADTTFNYTVDPAEPNGASGNAPSNSVTTQVNDANITTIKSVDKTVSDVGEVLTYTIVLTNTGNVAANNVVITDPVAAGTTFINGTLFGATGTPPTLNVPSIPAGSSATVSYQVLIGDAVPVPNPIANTADVAFTFTADPANPNGQTGESTSNTVNTQVSSATIETVKTTDKAFADVGQTITYTITVTNSGNVTANNVVLTDALPQGVSFVAGSLVGATGTPPTLNLNAPVPAGGSAVVSYQVLVGPNTPNSNPIQNSASAAFTYTVNPAQPNGASGNSPSTPVETQVNTAKLMIVKSANKSVAYLGDTITYQISLTNTGNVPANNVVFTDPIPVGTVLVSGSMTVSVPYTALPSGAIQLTNPVQPGEKVAISFGVLVTTIPNPNPIVNRAYAAFTYTVDPQDPNGGSSVVQTNVVTTTVFRNNFGQQITDLIRSVAMEEAALAAIANAEGAKIQRMAAMPGMTPHQLLCLNKSVTDMTDSLTMLEAVLKQKLSMLNCQISSESC